MLAAALSVRHPLFVISMEAAENARARVFAPFDDLLSPSNHVRVSTNQFIASTRERSAMSSSSTFFFDVSLLHVTLSARIRFC